MQKRYMVSGSLCLTDFINVAKCSPANGSCGYRFRGNRFRFKFAANWSDYRMTTIKKGFGAS